MSDGPAQCKVILCMSMSLDGFVARRDGVIDWLNHSRAHDASRHRAVLELLGQTGTLVLGRRVCEDMMQAWRVTQSPMADLMNALPKVVSRARSPRSSGATRASRAGRWRNPDGPVTHTYATR